MRTRSDILILGVVLVLMASFTGCSGKKKDNASDTRGNPLKPDEAGAGGAKNDVQRGGQKLVNENLMHNIGFYYNMYPDENGGRKPLTLDEFKRYVRTDPNARNVAAALDKDWIVMVLNPPPSGHQVLAYEKEAYEKWHNRLVLFADGAVETLDDVTFKKLVPNP